MTETETMNSETRTNCPWFSASFSSPVVNERVNNQESNYFDDRIQVMTETETMNCETRTI